MPQDEAPKVPPGLHPLARHGQQFDTHTYTHTHTHAQSLQQPLHGYCLPVNQHWDAWHQVLKPCVANPCMTNPSEAGLVTKRRAVQVSRIEIAETKVPQQPHTARTVEHLLPQFTPGTH